MRIVLIIWLCFLAMTANAAGLRNLQENESSQAIVLVGGFGSDFTYFEPWMPALKDSAASIFGFVDNHRSSTMDESSEALLTELNLLSLKGFTHVTILAHSMGGLVASKALHKLGTNDASRLVSIELRTYGTPWGGFFMANFARWVPGSQAVAKLLGFPMGAEIGSKSDFMESLHEPLPDNVKLVIYESKDDAVAYPKVASAVSQYESILTQASEVHRLSQVGHDDFVSQLAF